METRIQAHRGASAYYPENTLEAFSKAIEFGADAVELDTHLTKDGEIVVAHDAGLERVSNGTGYIYDHTLEELKALDFSKLHPGTVCRIPTLDEVFSLIKPSTLMMNIELKGEYPGLPEKLLAMIEGYGMGECVICSSFNHYSVRRIKELSPRIKTALIYNWSIVDPWVYANYLGVYAIHPSFDIVKARPEIVERCQEKGVAVNAWTLDEPEKINLMLKYGVDWITSNKADIAIACRNAYRDGR